MPHAKEEGHYVAIGGWVQRWTIRQGGSTDLNPSKH